MSEAFRVWMPDHQSESDGRAFTVDSARDAVTRFGEIEHDVESFDSMILHCRRIDGDVKRKAYEYHLDAEVEVHIDAMMAGTVDEEMNETTAEAAK